MEQHKFFASTPRGLEVPLSLELSRIGAPNVRITDGGVHFSGDLETCYKANLYSHTAGRIYLALASKVYRTEQDIYDLAFSIEWNEWFSVKQSFRVDVVATNCPLKSLNFASLKIKDAICDKFRKTDGLRPNVEPHTPDIRIRGFLDENQVIIFIDTSGDALFKRGFREKTNIAPIRENLACGLLFLSGWEPGIPLLDPMCGSGTFLIEAARISLNIAPGSSRKFAFEKLKNFDPDLWHSTLQSALENELDDTDLPIFGSDVSALAIEAAKSNLENAGLADMVKLQKANILDLTAPAESGVMIANLPYGERMGELDEMRKLYPKIGDLLKRNFAGWNACFLTSDLKMPRFIGLATNKRVPFRNGNLDCRMYEFKMVKGSNKLSKSQNPEISEKN